MTSNSDEKINIQVGDRLVSPNRALADLIIEKIDTTHKYVTTTKLDRQGNITKDKVDISFLTLIDNDYRSLREIRNEKIKNLLDE